MAVNPIRSTKKRIKRFRTASGSWVQSGHASATTTADGIYVVAVLKAQSDWVKVAQLERQ